MQGARCKMQGAVDRLGDDERGETGLIDEGSDRARTMGDRLKEVQSGNS